MAERDIIGRDILPPPGQYSPYETGRHVDDADGSISINLVKPVPQGEAEMDIHFSRAGRYQSATACMKHPNGLEVAYYIRPRKFSIQAWNPTSQFGHIYYGRTGTPNEIAPKPFVQAFTQFWKDAPTPEDIATMHKERAAFNAELDKLFQKYGKDVPLEEIRALDTSPVSDSYWERLVNIERAEASDRSRLIRRGNMWFILQEEQTEHTLEDITAEMARIKSGEVSEGDSWLTQPAKFTELGRARWGETFLFNEWRVTIDQIDGQVRFRQETVNRQKKKVLIAPFKVDHATLNNFGKDPENWDRVFETYPSKFYVEA